MTADALCICFPRSRTFSQMPHSLWFPSSFLSVSDTMRNQPSPSPPKIINGTLKNPMLLQTVSCSHVVTTSKTHTRSLCPQHTEILWSVGTMMTWEAHCQVSRDFFTTANCSCLTSCALPKTWEVSSTREKYVFICICVFGIKRPIQPKDLLLVFSDRKGGVLWPWGLEKAPYGHPKRRTPQWFQAEGSQCCL